ncbi:MAG: ParA family protein [Actinomycetaceae bacterium]|nr:ParA family protein [Actinomycetaceae bacterium]
MIIAVVNTKGGVGKTTSAIMLALAAHHAGKNVELFDADPQGSATDWAEIAKDSGTPLPFNVSPANAASLRRLHNTDNALYIIDTPPGDSKTVQAAVDCANGIIIPTLPSTMDFLRTWETLESVGDKKAAILLTSAETRTRALANAISALEEGNVTTFKNVIPKRQAIRLAAGTTPVDLFGYEAIYNELEEVFS